MLKRKQYTIYLFSLQDFAKNGYKLYQFDLSDNQKIKIAENQVCELIYKLTNKQYVDNAENFISELFFVQAKNTKHDKKALQHIAEHGLYVNNVKYVRFARSSSMARRGIISFIREDLYDNMMDLITTSKWRMDDEVVISKWEAYCGLAFSTCLFVDVVPERICIVPEHSKIISDYIKSYDIKQDKVIEGEYHVKVTLHDGMGVHSPEFGEKVAKALGLKEVPIAYQIRLFPFCKGMTFEFDFRTFYKERGITKIQDRWGKWWDIDELDAIWSETVFKGKSWFSSFDEFVKLRKKYYQPLGLYNLGIAKYSETSEKADKMTKTTYQYLQNLNLNGKDLIEMAGYTKNLLEKVYDGDPIYTKIFLGMLANTHKFEDDDEEDGEEEVDERYMVNKVYQAIMLNDAMLKDPYVKDFLRRQLQKSVKEFKLGRFYVNGRYSFVCQDPVYFLEYAAGLEPIGCLQKGEFYSTGIQGIRATFRSPLIHSSEVGKLNFISNELAEKWLGRYDNIIVVNCDDLTLQKHGGADVDGDTFFITDDKRIINAVIEEYKDEQGNIKKNYPVVDINEGTEQAKKAKISKESSLQYDLLTLDNQIGKITNYATYWTTLGAAYKNPNMHDDKLVYLRIAQGKEIDFVKTGFRLTIKDGIKQTEKPYFLQRYKYNQQFGYQKGVWYAPLNVLCRHIEQWEKKTFIWDKWDKCNVDLSGRHLLNLDLLDTDEAQRIYPVMRELYEQFKKELSQLKLEADNAKTEEERDAVNKKYRYFFSKYEYLVNRLSDNKELLSTIAVYLTYIENKKHDKSYLFPWVCTWEGLLLTMQSKQDIAKELPEKIDLKELEEIKEKVEIIEFLGNFYKKVKVPYTVNADAYIQHTKTRKQAKILDKQFDVVLVALADTAENVANALQNDVVVLKQNHFITKGTLQKGIALYCNDTKLCSISPKNILFYDDEVGFIDLNDYIDHTAQIDIQEIYPNSIKAKMRLVG